MLDLIALEIWVFGTVCGWLLATGWRGRALVIFTSFFVAVTGYAAVQNIRAEQQKAASTYRSVFDNIR